MMYYYIAWNANEPPSLLLYLLMSRMRNYATKKGESEKNILKCFQVMFYSRVICRKVVIALPNKRSHATVRVLLMSSSFVATHQFSQYDPL